MLECSLTVHVCSHTELLVPQPGSFMFNICCTYHTCFCWFANLELWTLGKHRVTQGTDSHTYPLLCNSPEASQHLSIMQTHKRQTNLHFFHVQFCSIVTCRKHEGTEVKYTYTDISTRQSWILMAFDMHAETPGTEKRSLTSSRCKSGAS